MLRKELQWKDSFIGIVIYVTLYNVSTAAAQTIVAFTFNRDLYQERLKHYWLLLLKIVSKCA